MNTLSFSRRPLGLIFALFLIIGCKDDGSINFNPNNDNEDTVGFRSCTRTTVTGDELALNSWDEEFEDHCENFNTSTGELNRLLSLHCESPYSWQLPSCTNFTEVFCTIDVFPDGGLYFIDLEDTYTPAEQDDIAADYISAAIDLAEEESCSPGAFGGHMWLIDAYFVVEIIPGGSGSYVLILNAKFGCCRYIN